LILFLVLPACGGGSALVAKLLGTSGSPGAAEPTNAAAQVSDVRFVGDTTVSPVELEFELTDPESDPVDVAIQVSVDGGAPVGALLVGNTSLTGLATSPVGVVHRREWDYASQFGAGRIDQVVLSLSIEGGPSSAASVPETVGNDAPAVRVTAQPVGEVTGPVVLELELIDSSADLVDVAVEFERLDRTEGWRPATGLGGGSTGLSSSPAGEGWVFLWDAPADLPGAECGVRVRFTPRDARDVGDPVSTGTLAIDNNAPPLGLVSGGGFLGNPDNRRGLAVPIQVVDAEGDGVELVYQWGSRESSIPALPATWPEVEAVLADATLRAQYQVATPFPLVERGIVGAATATSVVAVELSAGPSRVRSEFLEGRTLEILRADRTPRGVVSGWSGSPLEAPVGAVPLGDGQTAAILDQPAGGGWRLRELRLADGAVVRELGTGSGEPRGVCVQPAGDAVLVAAGDGTSWWLDRVDLGTGAVARWFDKPVGGISGPVWAVIAPSPVQAIVCVADAVVAVERPLEAIGGAVGTVRTLLAALSNPRGLAFAPKNPHTVFVAERDGVSAQTTNPDGRIVGLDLRTGATWTLTASGVALRRPTALAVDAASQNLWYLGDADAGDGTRELQLLRLNGGGGGPAFQLATGVPDAAGGLVSGPDGLLLYCNAATAEVSVGGGLQQARTITAWDPVTATVTVGSAFAPPVAPGARWRIEDRAERLPAGAATRRDTFVWDSADARTAGDAVLRVTPFDADAGTPTDTGVPRAVFGSMQVSPATIGGAASLGVRSIDLVDTNGDGLSDIVTADRNADSLSIYRQGPPGTFSIAADTTISGILVSPIDEPVAVVAADVNSDGQVDLVCANEGSDNIVLALQVAPGAFVVSLISLGGGVDPVALAVAPLDGDSRIDLAVAQQGSDRIALYYQLVAGVFLPGPSVLLSDPAATGPVDVVIADLDRDGDGDVISVNEGSDNLTIHMQTGAGVFDQPATTVLGGVGLTDGPVELAVGDFDRDGQPDLACANRDGNSIAVFLQQPGGGFAAAPSYFLASSVGPFVPRGLTSVDANGDGAEDLLVADGANNLLAFFGDPDGPGFLSPPLVVGTGGVLASPISVHAEDLSGDGQPDLVVANEATGGVGIFVQTQPGSMAGMVPSLVVGGNATTPDAQAVAVADLDGDGSLDLAVGSASAGEVSIYPQLGPGRVAASPSKILGSGSLAAVSGVVATDLDGDGAADLVVADPTSGVLAVFVRGANGFTTAPTQVLGKGSLQSPAHPIAADLDGDGDLDLACTDTTGHRVVLFRQVSTGLFTTGPWLSLGDNIATATPSGLVAADLDLDGDLDLAASFAGSHVVGVFLQAGPGGFSVLPDAALGGAGTTPQAQGVVSTDLNGDGLPDLLCVDRTGNALRGFLASAAGVFPAAPDVTIVDAAMIDPRWIGVADLDGDGWDDLTVAAHGTDRLVTFNQLGGGVFPFVGGAFGSGATTLDPSQVVCVDFDADGDLDVISVQPGLDNVAVFFNSH